MLRSTLSSLRNFTALSPHCCCCVYSVRRLRPIFLLMQGKLDGLPVPCRGECDIGLEFSDLARPNLKCWCLCAPALFHFFFITKACYIIGRTLLPSSHDSCVCTGHTGQDIRMRYPPIETTDLFCDWIHGEIKKKKKNKARLGGWIVR